MDDNLPIRVVDRHGLGITTSSSATDSAWTWRHGLNRGLHTLRSWLQQFGSDVPYSRGAANLEKKGQGRTESKRVEKYVASGSSGEGQKPGPSIMRTYMALCGFEGVGGDTSRPLAPGTGFEGRVRPAASPSAALPRLK
jgi:hypothetical protein